MWEAAREFVQWCGQVATKQRLPVVVGGDWNAMPLLQGRRLPRGEGWEAKLRCLASTRSHLSSWKPSSEIPSGRDALQLLCCCTQPRSCTTF